MSLRLVDGLAARLLRAHVAQRAEHRCRPGSAPSVSMCEMPSCASPLVRRLEQLGEAEVEDLRVAVRRDDHVLGLDVAVDDARLVGLLEPARHLDGRSRARRAGRARAPGSGALTVLPWNELHRDEDASRPFVDVVDLGDRGMVDRGRGSRLLDEARPCAPVRRSSSGQDLERDGAAERRVSRAR